MPEWNGVFAPSLDEMTEMALAARAALSAAFAPAAASVALIFEEFADPALLAEMQIEDPFELTGVYEGIPLPEKSVLDMPMGPDTIRLFRRPILDEWIDRGDIALGALVAHVYVHELAHHFGWSDDDIAAIDRWWE
jgi:predicted Zn-dependent protease with MMP-like domain